MKGNYKIRQNILAHFPQEQNFQQKHPFLPIKSYYLLQHQQQLAIQQQPPLPLHNNVKGGSLFWSSQSPAEATIARYTTPDGNSNSDDIRTVSAMDGVCFVENKARWILNKWNFPVRHGEKGIFYPFSKHNPSYLSKFPLNFNGCFICDSIIHREKYVFHELGDRCYG